MDNNRKQQCTTVAPPNRRILLHAPLLLLLVASGPCFAAEGDAEPGGAREIAGSAPDALLPGMQATGTSMQIARGSGTLPPHAPTPIAQASDASMQIAQAPNPALPTTVVVDPDAPQPGDTSPNTPAPVAQTSNPPIQLAQAFDTAPPNTSAPHAQTSNAPMQLAQASGIAQPETPSPVAPTSGAPPRLARTSTTAQPVTPTLSAQASGTPMPNSPAPVTQTPGSQPPSSQAPNSETPGAQLPGETIQRSQGPDVETPNAQAPNLGTADVATVRNDVFGLAASGGAIKALDEAKARPDAFSAVDIAQLEELSIRQQVRGGRDKSRSMTSSDRFDGLDSALRAADDLDKRMPATPEYTPVRTALAGDRTVAYAARGDMKTAVATFETIPSNAEISIDALAAVGDAYLYLSEPGKANAVYQRALQQATASPTDRATRGFQYGARTRPIELREGLFWSYVDQGRATEAKQVLDEMGTSLPPAKQVTSVGPEESDYLRYYRLRAQYLIFTGHVDEGITALEQLEKQVPFNAEIRAAHADAVSGQSHPRQAISMYRASLTDHPDSVEMLAGLGRASLTADDYASAKTVDQTLDNTFPDSGAVRSFKRDYNAYRSPVFTTDLSYEHGNSALADNSFSSDSYVYSQPFGDNWRVFSHTFFGYAQTDSGNISRTRTGIGGDYRHGPLTVQGEVTRSLGTDGRTGGRGTIAYALNDYWTVSAGLDTNDNSLPWKAYAAHIWGRSANVEVVYRQNDRRQVKLSYGVSRYSDANLHQEIAANVTQRVYTTANQLVNVSLDLGTDSNTRQDAPYFNPGRDYAAAATVMHQLTLWKKGDMSLQQRLSASGGVYNERGFGTSPLWSARLEHAWTFKHDITLTYGVEVSSHAYDGQRERSETGFMSVNLPF
ncbi:poly-beta-1,6 N-acetyl-D-glucosamine export porin PgaA [Burkholderia arboris]|uniref:poly-beta-1,6 N-acetyl-D-glucosamine export porin PgaA n=4 Tax=Pseudomonadota TaxID=1224 RepID=UPI001CA3EF08|nr:poly-beta-1,6 N-acetyl-D-glucosamine export porin PgaA [Burkholderia arboris]MBY8603664.1 poly-beta-1,6 N-acetyl-D-glucosamine export porin PgaA [Burkholderia arboris]